MAMVKSSSSSPNSVGYKLGALIRSFDRSNYNKMPVAYYNPITPTSGNTFRLLPFSSPSSFSNRSINQQYQYYRRPSKADFRMETTKRPAPSSTDQPPAAAASSWPDSFPSWVKWVMGWIICVAFPFWKQRWNHLLALQGEAEMVIKEAEEAAEVVEKVALASENMSAQMADNLPAQHTRLKDAALLVQHLSRDTAQHAQSLSNFIHKVDDLMQDLEELEDINKKK